MCVCVCWEGEQCYSSILKKQCDMKCTTAFVASTRIPAGIPRPRPDIDLDK